MAKNVTTTTEPTYCAAGDVARVLNKPLVYFTANTTPTVTSVNNYILEAEEIVDKDTQSAYRARKVTNEYHTVARNTPYYAQTGYRVRLNYKFIRELSDGAGDKLEVWNGTAYENYLTTKTEGRGNDFWLDYENGVLYIRGMFLTQREKGIRVTYRYGEEVVPANIKLATALQVAILLLVNEDNSFILNETGETRNMGYDQRIAQYDKKYRRIVFNQEQDLFVC